MGQPIAVRTDFTAVEVRRLARRAKDSDQVRRLLAIAAVLDGSSRAEAAKIGGMDRQTACFSKSRTAISVIRGQRFQ